jgi:quinoprotein glucose dehydrogenase
MKRWTRQRFLGALIAVTAIFSAAHATPPPPGLFDRANLTAWCIVPFDAKKRGPEARAEMMARLGFTHFAYDWRAEHIPQFDEEIETLKRWGIQLSAWWFPAALNEEAKAILAALKRHGEHPGLWVSHNGGEVQCTPDEHAKRVADHVAALRPLVEAAAAQGCKVGLYNHGGWFGEPENQIEIIKALNAPNVGLVYNLHHGHAHLDRFPALLQQMKPYLLCLNLNGMKKEGDLKGEKILPLGMGDLDLGLLRTVRDSGYAGPIGILGHTDDDAELTLRDNLEGLDWLCAQLDGKDSGPRPALHVGRETAARGVPSLSAAFGAALSGGLLADDNDAFRTPPFTVELRARLHAKTGFNILAACDTKASGAHWEIFTEAGSGQLSVYMPGLTPDHVRTGKDLCDGAWHQVSMHYEPARIRVYLDGALVADQAVQSTGLPALPGGFALGRLVEGGFFSDGEIDDVRISRGVRALAPSGAPLQHDGDTIALWNFDDLSASLPAAAEVEDPARRAALPEFQVIPAADPATLTPAQAIDTGATWTRSHGGDQNDRYATFTQITRENVAQLKQAWIYRSNDGPANIQCNPIVVDGTIFAPTSGKNIVAIDGVTGEERWRFTPGGQPAFRGLTYWPGDAESAPRLLFCAGTSLWALDPATGQPIAGFGDGGKATSGECRIAPAVFQHVIIIAGYLGNVYGFNVRTGAPLWTFYTIPRPGEPNADTWSAPEEGANCWGGIALDPQRGMVFISTGSPKPNFAGNNHTGQNLYANCVLALDALSGAYRWHFQELRHDIWDLDIPAPPVLTTLERDGRRVDVVAQVTKIGNTLVLDRVTGKPLFPVRLRRAPVSKLPGERTWPYQPDIELPVPFARQYFQLSDVTERTPEAHDEVLKRVTHANHGWYEAFEENKPTVLYGFHGGAEWTGAAADPVRGKLYVSANNMPWIVTVYRPDAIQRDPSAPPTPGQQIFIDNCAKCHGPDRFGVGMNPPLQGLARRLDDTAVRALLKTGRGVMPPLPETVGEAGTQALLDFLFNRDLPGAAQAGAAQAAPAPGPLRYTHNGYPKLLDPEGYPGVKPPWGTLNCIDLSTGNLDWQVPLGVYPALAEWGDDQTGAENFGGPSASSTGLVFCAGAADLQIRAFDAATGAVLWQHALPFGGYAPPTLYTAAGREFVLIPATGGGKLNTETGDAYVAFSL